MFIKLLLETEHRTLLLEIAENSCWKLLEILAGNCVFINSCCQCVFINSCWKLSTSGHSCWKLLKTLAGNCWKLLETLAENYWKVYHKAGNSPKCWKLLEMTGNAENCWNLLETSQTTGNCSNQVNGALTGHHYIVSLKLDQDGIQLCRYIQSR